MSDQSYYSEIDQLEKTLDEKIIETEMKKVKIKKTRRVPALPSNLRIRYPSAQSQNLRSASEMVATKNFGLNDDELETLSQYGCLGYFLGNHKWDEKKWIDENCFAILVKAIDHGMKKVSFELLRSTELHVGTSKLDFSAESKKLKDVDWKKIQWFLKFSLTCNGRKMRFRARCQVMDVHEGFERFSFAFSETDSNGVYERSFLNSEIPGSGPIFFRFHITLN